MADEIIITESITNKNYFEHISIRTGFYDGGETADTTLAGDSFEIMWDRADSQQITLTSDTQLVFTGATQGQKLTLFVEQTDTAYSLFWPKDVIWESDTEPVLQTPTVLVGNADTTFLTGVNSGGRVGAVERGVSNTGFLESTLASSVVLTDLATPLYHINDAVQQPDGRILCVGSFSYYGGTSSECIVRFHTNGAFDKSFNTGIGFATSAGLRTALDNDGVTFRLSMAIQSDGKVIVGGTFDTYNGNGEIIPNLIRLTKNGSVDDSFAIYRLSNFDTNDPPVSIPVEVSSIDVQSDDKIVITGGFTKYGLNTTIGIIRLNADGTIDNSFTSGTGFTKPPHQVKVLSNGKILCASTGSGLYNGSVVGSMTRLNSDGTLDAYDAVSNPTGFNSGETSTLFTYVSGFTIIPTGGMIVWGPSEININVYLVTRIDDNGAVNAEFDNLYFNGLVKSVVVDDDEDTVIVGGYFTSYDRGTPVPEGDPGDLSFAFTDVCNKIIRLSLGSGSIDTNFYVGADVGFDTTAGSSISVSTKLNFGIDKLIPYSDRSVLCLGTFVSYVNYTGPNGALQVPSGNFGAIRLITNTKVFDRITFTYNGKYYIGSSSIQRTYSEAPVGIG